MKINTIEYLEKAIWKTSRNLLRDFDELVSLKSNKNTVNNFITRAEFKTKEILSSEISEIPAHNFITNLSDMDDQKDGFYIMYSGLQDTENLSRSFEYFGYHLTCYKKSQGEISLDFSLIIFPVRKTILYAAQGKGAWQEKIDNLSHSVKSRLRVSNVKTAEEAIVNFDLKNKYPKYSNFRHFGSDLYHLTLVLMGTLDAAIINKKMAEFGELFIKESGGFIKYDDESAIISNSQLASDFK